MTCKDGLMIMYCGDVDTHEKETGRLCIKIEKTVRL